MRYFSEFDAWASVVFVIFLGGVVTPLTMVLTQKLLNRGRRTWPQALGAFRSGAPGQGLIVGGLLLVYFQVF